MGIGLRILRLAGLLVIAGQFLLVVGHANGDEFSSPWRDKSTPIILDAYEKNPIDWQKVITNKQVFGFIGKGSDGLPPRWGCRKPNDIEQTLCKKTFQNYWLKKELYQTRKTVAKSLGLKWGVYHLGRPGNPIEQANHFIDFTQPDDDDLLALDIEHDDPDKWISLKDAEAFVKHVKFRIGRYPILYTNHDTAKRIAARRAELPTLSRLPLWYARYRSDIRGAFPMGHWETYAIWQFSAHPNCNKRRCLYRVAGTKPDIDVNVASSSLKELEKAWPFGELLPKRDTPAPNNPDILMVSADKKVVTASLASPKIKKPVTRFKMNIEMENAKGKTIKLTSIAVPSPRNGAARQLGFEVAALDDDSAVAALPASVETVDDASLVVNPADFKKVPATTPHLSVRTRKTPEVPAITLASQTIPLREEAVRDIARATTKRVRPTYGYTNKRTFSAGFAQKSR